MSDVTLFSNNNLPDYLQEVELDDLTKILLVTLLPAEFLFVVAYLG
jgi:hypothetical protein